MNMNTYLPTNMRRMNRITAITLVFIFSATFAYIQFISYIRLPVTDDSILYNLKENHEVISVHRPYLNQPGELGHEVNIDLTSLREEESLEFYKGWERYHFNEYASRHISVRRKLQDYRDVQCLYSEYDKGSGVSAASVIVTYHDESWTVLLRTLHSIVDNSPDDLLGELVVVDDCSHCAHGDSYYGKLKAYLATNLTKVRLFQFMKKKGAVEAKTIAAKLSNFPVLVFLDSNVECTKGWLKPLVRWVTKRWHQVAVPVLDIIHDNTFKYSFYEVNNIFTGGFKWSLEYQWKKMVKKPKNRTKSVYPIRTATMYGMFAISKRLFKYIGGFDEGMISGGAENIDLSFKIWMCVGSIHVIPCSHVGHIFRNNRHANIVDNALIKNRMRVAAKWMDGFNKHFLQTIKFNTNATVLTSGDLNKQTKKKKEMKCKSFKWYLNSIYPEKLYVEHILKTGKIGDLDGIRCLQIGEFTRVETGPCEKIDVDQIWHMTEYAEIRNEDLCFEYNEKIGLRTKRCSGISQQKWEYSKANEIRHIASSLCIRIVKDYHLSMKPCGGNSSQQFQWSH